MESVVEITDRTLDGITILDIRASNFTYPQTTALKNYIAHLQQQGDRFFVFNMSQVDLVDSYGLATIISTLKMIKEKGGGLAMYGLNDTFQHLVEITQLHRVLEIWPSEAQAVYYLSSTCKTSQPH